MSLFIQKVAASNCSFEKINVDVAHFGNLDVRADVPHANRQALCVLIHIHFRQGANAQIFYVHSICVEKQRVVLLQCIDGVIVTFLRFRNAIRSKLDTLIIKFA